MTSRRRHSLVLSLALVTLGLGYSATASADATGYVCQSAWVTNPTAAGSSLVNLGAYGAIYAYIYSQPACKGSQLGFGYFCTTGATNTTYCTTTMLYTEMQAANLASSLQAAGASGQKVTLYAGSGQAGKWIEFSQP